MFIPLLLGSLLATSGCLSSEELAKDTTLKQSAIVFESADEFAQLKVASLDLCPTGFSASLDFAAANEAFGLAVTLTDEPATLLVAGPPGLDTLLFVYGPDDGTGFYGALPVASDDDSGPGLAAELVDFTAPTPGDYFIVVTTAGGAGQGAVTLEGSSASCSPASSDMDGDGVPDAVDNCPATPNPDQTDSNGDGMGDACDGTPLACTSDAECLGDPADPCSGALCVDGVCVANSDPLCGGVDTDGDGFIDADDPCPLDPTNSCTPAGACSDDSQCPGTNDPCLLSVCQTGVCTVVPDPACGTTDWDGDGIPDAQDNCPATPNPDQVDTDGDGMGDACDGNPAPCNSDADCGDPTDPCVVGMCVAGTCTTTTDPACGGTDTDGDGIPDTQDNCPATPNPGQTDTNGDGMGDACEGDPLACTTDADCGNPADPCMVGMCVAGVCTATSDPACGGIDTDGDGLIDADDPCPLDPSNSCAPAGCTSDADCDDNDMCTVDTCDMATAACVHTPEGSPACP